MQSNNTTLLHELDKLEIANLSAAKPNRYRLSKESVKRLRTAKCTKLSLVNGITETHGSPGKVKVCGMTVARKIMRDLYYDPPLGYRGAYEKDEINRYVSVKTLITVSAQYPEARIAATDLEHFVGPAGEAGNAKASSQQVTEANLVPIQYYRNSGETQPPAFGLISECKVEVVYYGVNLHFSVRSYVSSIERKLAQGVNFRLLLLNPCGTFLNQIQNSVYPGDDLSVGCIKSAMEVLSYFNKSQFAGFQDNTTSTEQGVIDIRFFDAPIHGRIFFIDPEDDSHGVMFFVPYMHGINTDELPGYMMQNAKSKPYIMYYEQFKKLWEAAETLQLKQFLADYPEMVEMAVFKK